MAETAMAETAKEHCERAIETVKMFLQHRGDPYFDQLFEIWRENEIRWLRTNREMLSEIRNQLT